MRVQDCPNAQTAAKGRGCKQKSHTSLGVARKTTNYNPMNIFQIWRPSARLFRYSKSPHAWGDLLSHLNLYNPMNIISKRQFIYCRRSRYKSGVDNALEQLHF
jgi:hypothetical protein